MALNRGPASDIDDRPFLRCHGCDRWAKCYRVRLLSAVVTLRGTFERWDWRCRACFAALVEAALLGRDDREHTP